MNGAQAVQSASTVRKVRKVPKGQRVHQGRPVLLVLTERRVRSEFQDSLDIQEDRETKGTRVLRVGMVQSETRESGERMASRVNVA